MFRSCLGECSSRWSQLTALRIEFTWTPPCLQNATVLASGTISGSTERNAQSISISIVQNTFYHAAVPATSSFVHLKFKTANVSPYWIPTSRFAPPNLEQILSWAFLGKNGSLYVLFPQNLDADCYNKSFVITILCLLINISNCFSFAAITLIKNNARRRLQSDEYLVRFTFHFSSVSRSSFALIWIPVFSIPLFKKNALNVGSKSAEVKAVQILDEQERTLFSKSGSCLRDWEVQAHYDFFLVPLRDLAVYEFRLQSVRHQLFHDLVPEKKLIDLLP